MRYIAVSGIFFTALLLNFLAPPGVAAPFNFRGLDIKVKTAVNEAYDDNITSAGENKKGDFVTSLALGLDVKDEGKTRSLKLSGNIRQQVFAQKHSYNNISQGLSLSFRNEFSKYDRITLKNAFSHTYEPRSFKEAFGRTSGRYSYYRNRFNLDYTRDISRQLSLSVSYANELNEISGKDLNDSYLNRLGFEADYFFSSATVFLFSYEFAGRNFNSGEDASTHTIAAGIKHYLSRQFYFDGKTGVDFVDSYSGRNYTKPIISISLADEIDENTRAAISFTKEYSANSYRENLFSYRQISAFFTRRLLERLGCSFSGFYGRGEYTSSNITDKLRGVSVGFSYDLRKNLKGKLTYTYSKTDSTPASREYTKNVVSAGLSAEF